jgi:hypothetical protein
VRKRPIRKTTMKLDFKFPEWEPQYKAALLEIDRAEASGTSCRRRGSHPSEDTSDIGPRRRRYGTTGDRKSVISTARSQRKSLFPIGRTPKPSKTVA